MFFLFLAAGAKSSAYRTGATDAQPQSQASSLAMPSRVASLLLRGHLRGGKVVVWVKGRELTVDTVPNESTRRLARRIAEAINADPELRRYGVSSRADGAEVAVAVSEYWLFLCTTDSGLEGPPAPRDLRADLREGRLVDLRWQVPQAAYDSVHLLRGTLPVGDEMAGTATQFTDYLATEDAYTYYVFGIKGGMPSCAASVVVPARP
jgi:hypothetical protein